MRAKKATLKDGRNLTGRVSFLRSGLVCLSVYFKILSQLYNKGRNLNLDSSGLTISCFQYRLKYGTESTS